MVGFVNPFLSILHQRWLFTTWYKYVAPTVSFQLTLHGTATKWMIFNGTK